MMKANIHRLYQTINKPLIIILIFPFIFLLVSFKPVGGSGVKKLPVIKKEFKIENAFQSIRIEGDVSIVLTNAPAGTIIIEGKEKDLQKISPVLENSTLVIDANRKCLFTKLTIYLSALRLQAIQLNGDGNISSFDLIQSAYLHISLNGNIKVKVKTMGKISFYTPDNIELLKPQGYGMKNKLYPDNTKVSKS